MNMQTSRTFGIFGTLVLLAVMLTTQACKKEYSYEVNEQKISSSSDLKTKAKSEEQFVAILYANLFQKALSANKLVEITDLIASIGDKDLAHEVLISNFMNDTGVLIPSDSLMRADPESFIIKSYERFLVRKPSQGEITFFRNFIDSHPDLSAEMVYFSFALSNEYLYY